jgi:Glucosamine-6-phosphate isomerases/6-phosphogluconolactonase
MSPTHSNKLGVRYRYYVSHAILQNRRAEAGGIARVPAPEVDPALESSRHVAFLVVGKEKRAIFDRLRRGDDSLPAARLHPTGALCLFGDAAAETIG